MAKLLPLKVYSFSFKMSHLKYTFTVMQADQSLQKNKIIII